MSFAQTLASDTFSNLPKKVQELLNMTGQFVRITYAKECKVRKGAAQVYKSSKMTLRCGIEYDNVAAVIAKRESGELPAENAGIAWGSYVPNLFPYIIEHKETKALYFRFMTVPHTKTESVFVSNGKEISREEAKVLCLASEFAERETTLETITLKIEGILNVNGVEVV